MTLSPIAFSIGPWPIRWYGLAYMSGLLFFWFYARLCVGRGLFPPLKTHHIDHFVNWLLLAIVIGGRLGHVFLYEPSLLYRPMDILKLWQPGMAFHGGLFGVFIAVVVYTRKIHVPFLVLADCCAASAPIGLFLGRIANFVNQELYGRPTRSFLGVIFPMVDHLKRHPSQLYEAALEGLVLFFFVTFLTWKKCAIKKPGMIFGVFLLGYALARWICELFREPLEILPSLGLTMGQFYSLPLIAAGLFFIYPKKSHQKNKIKKC